jgi:hypothetical protein
MPPTTTWTPSPAPRSAEPENQAGSIVKPGLGVSSSRTGTGWPSERGTGDCCLSAPRAQKVRSWCRRPRWMRCCAGDEGLALRRRPAGGDVKPPQAALAEDRRGERWGKGALDASGGDREGERERTADDVSKQADDIETGRLSGPGMSLAGARVLAGRCPAWRRREPGLRLLHGTWEGGCRYGCPGREGWAARGSAPSGRNR